MDLLSKMYFHAFKCKYSNPFLKNILDNMRKQILHVHDGDD